MLSTKHFCFAALKCNRDLSFIINVIVVIVTDIVVVVFVEQVI